MSQNHEIVLDAAVEENLRHFLRESTYSSLGGVIVDLDGTIVHEDQGRTFIPDSAKLALKELYDLKRPFILNTLRFPLSVLRTFGKEWYELAHSPIPTVTLNGSQLGFVTTTTQGELTFEEISAFPLTAAEIDEVLDIAKSLVAAGISDMLIFQYPRDWRMGEIIWTPLPEKVIPVKEKYLSASSVTAVELLKFTDQMHSEETCMVFLLIDIPQDKLMAYQHTKRSQFHTRRGVDKLFGARQIATHLGIDLSNSIGAGDTEMDSFLADVGLAILVGNADLQFQGLSQTIKLRNPFELSTLLFRLAAIQRELLNENKG